MAFAAGTSAAVGTTAATIAALITASNGQGYTYMKIQVPSANAQPILVGDKTGQPYTIAKGTSEMIGPASPGEVYVKAAQASQTINVLFYTDAPAG